MDGQTAINPQTGERIVLRGGQWVPVGAPAAPRTMNIPMAPQAQTAQNLDTANTVSLVGSRDVQNENTAVNTAGQRIKNQLSQLDLENAIRSRAKGYVAEDEFTKAQRSKLMEIRAAEPLIHRRSTGAIGELIGQPGRDPARESYDLADIPFLGQLIYGGSDRSRLQTKVDRITSGEKFDMLQIMKERSAAAGASGSGLGATSIPEFQALGQNNFNLETLAGGPEEVAAQLANARELMLRRYAATRLPLKVLMQMPDMTPAQRQGVLAAATEAARKEYEAGFKNSTPAAASADLRAAAIAELKRRGKKM